MNEKFNSIYEEEKVISLPGLCFFVLKKWKMILLSAIVFAVVAISLFSYKNYENAKRDQDVGAQEKLEQLAVPEDQKEIVHMKMENFENSRETIKEYEYYYNNSIKVRLDPNNVNQGLLWYVVSSEKTEEVLKATTICEYELFSEDVYQELGKQLSEPVDVAMLKEVIYFDKYYVTNSYRKGEPVEEIVFKYMISVRHFNEEDCARMLDFMSEKMEQLPELLAAENVNVKVEKVAEKLEKVCDRSLATLSKNVRDELKNCYESITTTINNMNDQQKKYYDYLMTQEVTQEVTQEQQTVDKSLMDYIDVKMGVVGAIAGAMLVAGVYVLIYLFNNRVHNAEELQSWISTPVINFNKNADLMLTYVAGIVVNQQMKQICLTGTLTQLNEELMNQVKTMLEEQGCQVVCGKSIVTDAETIQKATECGNMILFEKCGVSKQKNVKDILIQAASCNINVLGIVLEK